MRSFGDLNDSNMISVISNWISNNFSNVKGIYFDNNGIQSLEVFGQLKSAKQLSYLSFKGNELSSLEGMSSMIGLPLLELNLSENKFQWDCLHGHQVRLCFPSIRTLNEEPVESIINFNIRELLEQSLPPPNPYNYFSDGIEGFCCEFIREYYRIFDMEGPNARHALDNLYDVDACFSLSIRPLELVENEEYLDKINHNLQKNKPQPNGIVSSSFSLDRVDHLQRPNDG